MTDKRRPAPINPEANKGREWGLTSFTQRYEQYEKLRQSEDLTTGYISFDALTSILGAIEAGHSEDEILAACPKAWGTDAVKIPASLIIALVGAWRLYKDGPSGQTLGEAFGIEGGGQGKKRSKDLQATRDRRRRLAADVEVEYRVAEIVGPRITQVAAIELVSGKQDIAFSTVEAAHDEYKAEIRSAMASHGLTEEKG